MRGLKHANLNTMKFLMKILIGTVIALAFFAWGLTDWRFWMVFIGATLLLPSSN